MRIIYVTSSLPYGPGEAFIVPEVLELRRLGHDVIIVPMRPKGDIVHEDARALVDFSVTEPLLSWNIVTLALKELLFRPRRCIRALSVILRGRSPLIVAKNLIVFPKSLWLASQARRFDTEHFHVHWAATTATMTMVAHELTGVPWSMTAHRWDIVEDNLLARKMKQAVFTRFISHSGLHLAKRTCPHQVTNKTLVLHMGVDVPQHKVADIVPNRFRPVALCPANLIPVKGHVFLLEAFRILKDRGIGLDLWLAGDGELRGRLEEAVKRLGIEDRVAFLGQVDHSALLDLYAQQQIGIVVLASVDLGKGLHEGIPVSLIEAMSYGIPVVATKTGGIPELIEAPAGKLVPPENADALADALGELTMDREHWCLTGQAGRERIKTVFSIRGVVERLSEQFYAGKMG